MIIWHDVILHSYIMKSCTWIWLALLGGRRNHVCLFSTRNASCIRKLCGFPFQHIRSCCFMGCVSRKIVNIQNSTTFLVYTLLEVTARKIASNRLTHSASMQAANSVLNKSYMARMNSKRKATWRKNPGPFHGIFTKTTQSHMLKHNVYFAVHKFTHFCTESHTAVKSLRAPVYCRHSDCVDHVHRSDAVSCFQDDGWFFVHGTPYCTTVQFKFSNHFSTRPLQFRDTVSKKSQPNLNYSSFVCVYLLTIHPSTIRPTTNDC